MTEALREEQKRLDKKEEELGDIKTFSGACHNLYNASVSKILFVQRWAGSKASQDDEE